MGYYKQKSVIGQPPEDSVTIDAALVPFKEVQE